MSGEDFYEAVIAAAGPALADPARCIGVTNLRDLLYLRIETPTSPACTDREIIDAVAWTGDHMLNKEGCGPGSMVNYALARKKAIEWRDKRIHGVPVKALAVASKPVEGLGDPRDFDEGRWQALIVLSNSRGGQWKDEWGPPPGEAGTFVPERLWAEWSRFQAVEVR